MQFSDTIKEHIEKLLCPVHDIHPMVEQDWDGVKISACCKEFEMTCLKEAERLIQAHPVEQTKPLSEQT